MNRYLIDGIAADVLDGKSVVYVGYSHEIQGLRDGVAARLIAAGCEPKDKRLSVVSLPNGGSVTLCSDPRQVRGLSADVLVVDERAHHDLSSDLLPTIADGEELIRL